MRRYVVDTNVPIVANGRPDPKDKNPPSLDCRIAAVKFLQCVLSSGTVLVDLAGEIQAEYRTYFCPNGQPGVGDRFYREVLNSAPHRIERIELPKRDDGEYADLLRRLLTLISIQVIENSLPWRGGNKFRWLMRPTVIG